MLDEADRLLEMGFAEEVCSMPRTGLTCMPGNRADLVVVTQSNKTQTNKVADTTEKE